MVNVVPTQTGSEWDPHAEKEFGRFTHALAKTLPARLTSVRRLAKLTLADSSSSAKRGGR